MKYSFVSKSAKKHLKKQHPTNYKEIIEVCERDFIYAITPKDKMYPDILKRIPDFPKILFIRDNHKLLKKKKKVAVVGCRRSSNRGDELAKKVVKHLVKKKFTVVSGEAKGIDTIARESCREFKGSFIMVVPSLIRIPTYYNSKMDICVISENHPLYKYKPKDLMLRNRIQAGLAQASIPVEFSNTKGTERHLQFARQQKKTSLYS